MNDKKKPEWFELVDGDAPSAQVTKINKKLPAIAVLAAGSVMALGTFFSSATETDAQATTSTLQSQTVGSESTSVAAESPQTSSPAPAAVDSTSNNSGKSVVATNNPSLGGVQAPGLASGHDDEDEDEDEDDDRRGHDDDDDHDRHGHDDDDDDRDRH